MSHEEDPIDIQELLCPRGIEYVFLFAKSPRYYYDADAVRESAETNVKSKILGRGNQGYARASGATKNPQRDQAGGYGYVSEGKRNRRTVWNVATHPFKGAHFATFPPKLIPCTPRTVGGVVLTAAPGRRATFHRTRRLICVVEPTRERKAR